MSTNKSGATKAWRKNNPDKDKVLRDKWNASDKRKLADKRYREKHKDKELLRHKQYRENNKDKELLRHKQYREDNKDKIALYHVTRQYGITKEVYAKLLVKQNNSCAICHKPKKLHVDHDHKKELPGAVRELLCQSCNNRVEYAELGYYQGEDVAKYLEKHS